MTLSWLLTDKKARCARPCSTNPHGSYLGYFLRGDEKHAGRCSNALSPGLPIQWGSGADCAGVCKTVFKPLSKRYFRDGIILGGLLFSAYTIQTYGLHYTTPSKNAFLTAAYCVLVPFVSWMMLKKRPDKFHFISAALCLAGVGFVSLKNDHSIEIGDLLTLCCSAFYAVHIILTGKYVKNRSVPLLIIIQFATAGSLAWISALINDSLSDADCGGEYLEPCLPLRSFVRRSAF